MRFNIMPFDSALDSKISLAFSKLSLLESSSNSISYRNLHQLGTIGSIYKSPPKKIFTGRAINIPVKKYENIYSLLIHIIEPIPAKNIYFTKWFNFLKFILCVFD